MSESNALDLEDFGIAFGDEVVLQSVRLSVPARGCTVVLGAARTGKSSLLRTLSGVNWGNPALRTWGQALYRQRPCTTLHHPALVTQTARLLVSNVLESLVDEMAERFALSRSMQVERVAAVLRHCGQAHLLDRLSDKVAELPLHQQRVVTILRSVMAEPGLLCIDDPVAGLDPAQAPALLSLIGRLADECAVLVTLRHWEPVRHLEARLVWLSDGVLHPSRESAQLPTSSSIPTLRAEPVRMGATLATAWAHSGLRTPGQGPSGFHWLLRGQLAGTPWPGVVHDVRYDLDVLRSVGITRLISLTEAPFDPVLAAQFGMSCLSSPMPDMAPPTQAQALALCHAVDAALRAGEVVAVHCHAGLGRTGTVLVSYALWRARGQLSAMQALADARRIHPGWVQSSAQVQFLETFAAALAAGVT